MSKKTKKQIKASRSRKAPKVTPTPEPVITPVVVEEVAAEAPKDLEAPSKNHFVITQTDSKLAKWFVIHTYSGHENSVAVNMIQRVTNMKLEDKVFELLIPT